MTAAAAVVRDVSASAATGRWRPCAWCRRIVNTTERDGSPACVGGGCATPRGTDPAAAGLAEDPGGAIVVPPGSRAQIIRYNGRAGKRTQWAAWLGISVGALNTRMRTMPLAEALTAPNQGWGGSRRAARPPITHAGRTLDEAAWAKEIGLSVSQFRRLAARDGTDAVLAARLAAPKPDERVPASDRVYEHNGVKRKRWEWAVELSLTDDGLASRIARVGPKKALARPRQTRGTSPFRRLAPPREERTAEQA